LSSNRIVYLFYICRFIIFMLLSFFIVFITVTPLPHAAQRRKRLSDMLGWVDGGVMMRKTILANDDAVTKPVGGVWLDLEKIARVEISSEDAAFPIEHALGAAATTGWRAAGTGPQTVRIHFDDPQAVRRIQVHVIDRATERSQEFAIFAETDGGRREVVRQQFSFSPGGSTEEIEDYSVELNGVTMVELKIDPDRSHDPKQSQNYASLQSLRLG
jgi:hypothetical protein